MKKGSWYGITAFLWSLCALYGGDSVSGSPPFFHLDLSEGLSHKTVYAIHQDRRGFMWFCTENGLNRYDGNRFVVYHHDPLNPLSISDDNVNSLVEDDSGYFWIGSWGGGLNRFDPRTGEAIHFPREGEVEGALSDKFVQSLASGRGATLWVGTFSGGLNRFDKKTGQSIVYRNDPDDPNSLNHNRVWAIYPAQDGRIWLGTDQGLNIFNPTTEYFETFKSPEKGPIDLSNAQIRTLVAQNQWLWVGTGNGLARIDMVTGSVAYFEDFKQAGSSGQDAIVNDMYPSPGGEIWVGMLFDGLKRWNPQTGMVRDYQSDSKNPLGLKSNDIRALYEDRSGNLWVGTRSGGVSRLDLKPKKFETYAHIPGRDNGLAAGGVRSITTDQKGYLWVGSRSNGLTRIDRILNRYKRYEHDPDDPRSLSNSRILALTVDGQDNLWVGTFEGLNRMGPDRTGVTRFFHREGDAKSVGHSKINALLCDRDGEIWAGTQGGLSRYGPDGFTNYSSTASSAMEVGFGRVNVLCEDRQGRIWAGMGQGGLWRFDRRNQHFGPYTESDQIPNHFGDNAVLSITTHRDMLWIGTFGGGLNRLDPSNGTFTSYLRGDGLPNNVVYGVLPSHDGSLWLSTNRGLSQFNPEKGAFRNYDIYDGLQGNQFSMGAYHRHHDGELFFGGVDGLNAFFPGKVQDHYFIPPVVISGLKIGGVVTHDYLVDGSEVVLDADIQHVTVEFAALDFTRPEKNQYQCILEGLDADWRAVGSAAAASYTLFSPGEYVFKIRGANHDGIWNEYGASIKLTVAAGFWDIWSRPMTIALVTLLFLALVFYLHRYRTLQKSKLEALARSEKMAVEANRSKSAFLAHMSHELRTPLNAIIGFSELVEEDLNDYDAATFQPKQCLADLAKIKSSAYQQLAQVNNLLELTKLESGKGELFIETFDVRTMVQSVLHHIQPMLEKNGNHMEVRFAPKEIGEMTADNMKIQGILINLLTNANKFTKDGLITLSILRTTHAERPQIVFQVQDTGVGMSTDKLGTIIHGYSLENATDDGEGNGLGLYISQQFSKMMGGEIGVESQLSKGTTFSVKLPVEVDPD